MPLPIKSISCRKSTCVQWTLWRLPKQTSLMENYTCCCCSTLWQGKSNPITLSRVYDVPWLCEYDMRWWDFQLNPLPSSTDLYFCFPGIHLIHRHVSCNFRQGLVLRLEKKGFSLSQIEGNGGEFVELVPESLDYLGPQDLTQYFIRWLKQKWKTKSNSFLLLGSLWLRKIKLCFFQGGQTWQGVFMVESKCRCCLILAWR